MMDSLRLGYTQIIWPIYLLLLLVISLNSLPNGIRRPREKSVQFYVFENRNSLLSHFMLEGLRD